MMPSNKNTFDSLVIIGNGFDIWQGLNTSYSQFRKYYLEHRGEILKRLKLKPYMVNDKDYITDVELVYGDPFSSNELDEEFWYAFESSLDKVNAERINAFFGKTNKQLYHLQTAVENAQSILREAFSDWIETIKVEQKDSGFTFGDNCYCINFNYTDTVEKRFETSNICHIHGARGDVEDIVFGHSTHPQRPIAEFVQFGGRFMGLYIIESLLYETDKHTHENIQFMRVDLASDGVKLDHIKDIYVVGHSFGPADVDYFKYFMEETSVKGTHFRKKKMTEPITSIDELHLRMQYSIHKYGEGSPVSKEEVEAVKRSVEFEHIFDEEDILSDFYPCLPELKRIGKCETDANWHISYYSDKDRERIIQVMQEIECTNYTLYSTIDECLTRFKKNYRSPIA